MCGFSEEVIASYLKEFSFTELANATGDVLAAAAGGPVAITRNGKPRFVVLSIEDYDRLRRLSDTCRAFHVSDLTDSEADALMAGLRNSIDND